MSKPWSYDAYRAVKQVTNPLVWDVLSKDEQNVISARGGLRSDNVDARPDDWKQDGAHRFVWIYRQADAVQKVYTFDHGRLVSAVSP